jgi:predicted alpha/beta-fold hydrolase
MVAFNHYAPEGEKDMRLMDMNENRHLDEVIRFVKSKFDKEGEECELYLVGFSLGANHSLRYAGSANMLRQKNE